MQKIRALVLLVLLCPGYPSLASAGAASPGAKPAGAAAHTIAVIPFYSPEKIWTLYTPFVDHLKRATGLAWELKLYQNHDALLDDLCQDRLAVALLGPAPMGRAFAKCGVRPFLVALGKDGNPFYRSILLTGDPAVRDPGGLRGRKVGFYRGSTASHIIPVKMLQDAGLPMSAIQPAFYESQDRIMAALLTREIAAAGVKEALYLKFRNEPLKMLRASDPLPNFAFCGSPALSPAVRTRMVDALIRIRPSASADDAAAVRDWDDEIRNGFMLPTDEYLASVVSLHAITREILHEDR